MESLAALVRALDEDTVDRDFPQIMQLPATQPQAQRPLGNIRPRRPSG